METLILSIALVFAVVAQLVFHWLNINSYQAQLKQQMNLTNQTILKLLARTPREAVLLSDLENRLAGSGMEVQLDREAASQAVEEARIKLAEINKVPDLEAQIDGSAFEADLTEGEELPAHIKEV